jgi:hypothetical protein
MGLPCMLAIWHAMRRCCVSERKKAVQCCATVVIIIMVVQIDETIVLQKVVFFGARGKRRLTTILAFTVLAVLLGKHSFAEKLHKKKKLRYSFLELLTASLVAFLRSCLVDARLPYTIFMHQRDEQLLVPTPPCTQRLAQDTRCQIVRAVVVFVQ